MPRPVLARMVAPLTVVLVLAGAGRPVAAVEADRDTIGSAGIGDPYFPLDGNGGIDVLHYDVRVRYDFDTGRLTGRTALRVRATQDLSRFNLDLLLPVSRVQVDGRAAQARLVAGHELRITPRRQVTEGETFRVRVDYAGRPATKTYAGESNWLADDREVVTMNQPHMAPWWFAANDHPRDKATMDVRVTVPRHTKVVSNGLPVRRTVRGDRATSHWRSTEPMAAYLAFFAAGPFEVSRGQRDGLPWLNAVSRSLPQAARRSSAQMLRRTPAITSWLEDVLGDYPFDSTGGLVTALSPGFALENQTRPTYPALGPGATTLLVHELAHQWFGDSVAVDGWRDIVLNEGLATFMEQYWTESTGGVSAASWLRSAYDARRDEPSFWSLRPDDPGPSRMFDGRVYLRGAMAAQALRTRLGDETFWQVLRTWLADRAGGNGSVAQFAAHAAEVSGQDLTEFFDAWLSQPTAPADTSANGL